MRSLPLHAQDIINDPIMMASSVICLTETSLNTEWQGWSDFKDFTVYQKTRRETASDSNQEARKSGGVALLHKKSYHSFCNESVADKYLEMVSMRFRGKESAHVTLLYKDQKMSKKDFLSRMDQLFSLHGDREAIIMGDFNIDMKQDNSLETVARANGFLPIVDVATTIYDSLLDQVFINFPMPRNWEVISLQSYFSDHNLVVLCLKKKEFFLD